MRTEGEKEEHTSVKSQVMQGANPNTAIMSTLLAI